MTKRAPRPRTEQPTSERRLAPPSKPKPARFRVADSPLEDFEFEGHTWGQTWTDEEGTWALPMFSHGEVQKIALAWEGLGLGKTVFLRGEDRWLFGQRVRGNIGPNPDSMVWIVADGMLAGGLGGEMVYPLGERKWHWVNLDDQEPDTRNVTSTPPGPEDPEGGD